jgi:uncharacterized protein (DUF2147 family)
MIAAATLFMAGTAAADPIEGNWRTQSGATAAISNCGGSFCITLKSSKHKGKQIGKMSAQGESEYAGSITDPETDKTYSGKGSISGSTLKMKGCVLGGLICKSQTWTKL